MESLRQPSARNMAVNYRAPWPFWRKKRSLADDIRFLRESPSSTSGKHVVIIMDGLEDFTLKPLEWALENIAAAGCTVTLLGLMPWLNIPLSSKTWRDVWMLEFEDLDIAKVKNTEWKSDFKYLKLQAVVDICNNYGVLLQKEVVMGYPPRLLVVERIISLHATWVVFDSDKYHKKNREFYTEKIPCNMVMMNEEGGFDLIKRWPMIGINGDSSGSTAGESPTSLVPTPQLMISQRLKAILEETEIETEKDDQD